MKVLMINTVPTERNGITSVIVNLVNHIDNADIVIDLMSINQPSDVFFEVFQRKNGKVFINPRIRGKIISYFSKLIFIIKKNKYDIVHIHGNSHTVSIELLAAFLAGCRVRVVHSHSTRCKAQVLNKLLSPLFFLTYTKALACGEEAGKWMFGNKQFTIVQNGIDLEKFKFSNESRLIIRNRLGLSNGQILVGHVGNFIDEKNHKFLIDVYNELSKKTPQKYKLILIGDGQLMQNVRNQVHKNNLDNEVIFVGSVENVSEYLSAIDIIVMPSLFEGFPVTLIEEQANGLECIVSNTITKKVNVTGLVEFKHLSDGKKLWAEQIRETPINNHSRLQRSKDAIKSIDGYGLSIDKEASRLCDIYNSLVSAK